jgi:hypothetical protein
MKDKESKLEDIEVSHTNVTDHLRAILVFLLNNIGCLL